MSGVIGYDLDRIGELRRQTVWAIAALDVVQSSDPATEHLGAAIRVMRRVLEDHWLATLTEIERSDPLGTAPPSCSFGRWDGRWPGVGSGATGLLAGVIASAGPRTWSDAAIFAELARFGDLLGEEVSLPVDLSGPWASFRRLAEELDRRAGVDPDFADELARRLLAEPIIGLAAGVAPFAPSLAATLLSTTLAVTSHVDDLPTRQAAAAADGLLRSLLADPSAVLDVLGEHASLREMLTWPFLDPDLVAEVALTGLLTPVADPERLADGHRLLRRLVEIANDPFFDRSTMRSPIPEALAAGVATYLPTFVASMEQGDPVNLKGLDGKNVGMSLGTYDEVLDFFGMLLRNPAAAGTLLATIQPLTAAAASGDGAFQVADVGDFALTLVHAAENERVEDEMHAAALRSLAGHVTVAVGLAAGGIAATLRFGEASSTVLSQLVKGGGQAAVDRIDAPDEDAAADPAGALEASIEFALYETFLDDPRRYSAEPGGIDSDVLTTARDSLERVRTLAEQGASVVSLGEALQDVHADIVRLGGGPYLAELDRGSIRALDAHDPATADLTRTLD